MKTIKDAYEELNGDLSNSYDYRDYEETLYWDERDSTFTAYGSKMKRSTLQYICTVEEFNNYTPKKTVRDAVIDFKGDWGNAEYADIDVRFIFECVDNKDTTCGIGTLVGDSKNNSPENYREVCTRDEFNTYVDLLASNMGNSTQSYEEYKALYNSVMGVRLGGVGHAGYNPEQPVFTQEMADNGVLPSVGMEVELVVFENLTSLGHIEFKNEVGFLFRYKENNLCDFMEFSSDIAFKPLTPPLTDKEKLIEESINEMIRRCDLSRAHDEYMDCSDTQVGVEFAIEYMGSRGISFKPLTVEGE